MRPYEAGRCGEAAVVSAGVFVVVRLDGRGFTGLMRARHEFDRPFDVRVRDIMIATADHLMNCGVEVAYGYTQSDEISLLLRPGVVSSPCRLLARLAGEASAKFTLLLGALASFDARVSELPDSERVVDYFRWRQADAGRHALAEHCLWTLRQRGVGAAEAASRVQAAGPAEQRALLRALEVEVDALPGWQTRGVGLCWERTSVPLAALRRRIRVLLELPEGDEYAELLRAQARQAAAPEPDPGAITAG